MAQRNATPKRLICWDMGNVFLPWDTRPFLEIMAPYTPLPIEELDSRLMKSGLFDKFMVGEYRTQLQFFAAYVKLMEATSALTYEIFVNAWNLIFRQNREIGPLLARIRYGVRMVIISNSDPLMYKHIRAHPEVKRYMSDPSHHFLSHKEGVLKPQPAIFTRTFARTGIPAEAAILVDDVLEHKIAFEALGGTGICWNAHLHPIEELEEALEAHGVFHDK
jgi:putative hydrolase of the HAD superfamily